MSTSLRLGWLPWALIVTLCAVAPVAAVAAEDTATTHPAPLQSVTPPSTETPPSAGQATDEPAADRPAAQPDDGRTDAATEEMLAQASFSMQLHKAPLMQMLTLIGASSPVRFRYATPPDAVVTTTLQDAPLLSTLENLLHSLDYATHREGLNIFICRWDDRPNATRGAATSPIAWQIWTRRVPPPSRWMAPSPLPNQPRVNTTDQWQIEKNQATAAIGVAWQPAPLRFEAAHRPGVVVDTGSTFPENSSDGMVYLRWNLTLEQVPRGAQLLLETPDEATFYVNGAPLLRKFRNIRLVDLGEVLQPGENCLAIALRTIQEGRSVDEKAGKGQAGENRNTVSQGGSSTSESNSATKDEAKSQSQITGKPPILRYEWFFGGDS